VPGLIAFLSLTDPSVKKIFVGYSDGTPGM
jgi:hypothetical protein